MFAFLVSFALAGDSYVPPVPPPRVITYTEMRFETRYTYAPIVTGTSYSAPAATGSPTGSVHSSAPPPETDDQKCARGDAAACHQVASNFHWNGDSAKALEMFGKLCDQGRTRSCTAAGFVAKKPADTERYLQRGCDGGDLDACGDLGFRLLDGVGGMPVDDARAARLFERGCASGSPDGCVGLGWLHLLGKGGYAFDPKAAVPYGQKACPDPQRGKAEPCLERARFHEWAGDRAAASLVRLDICYQPKIPGAKMAEACRLVAPVLYHGGEGMKADTLGAFAAYERACGYDGESCLWAARLAKLHPGYREPLELAERSCNGGYAQGCTTYAEWLGAEPGGYEDRDRPTKVREARRKGCDLGDPVACARIGMDANSFVELEKGCVGGVVEACTRADEVVPERARVAAMFGRACEGGVGAACVSAGEMAAKGEGVPASAAEALAWFEKACTDGDRAGCVRVADSLLDRGAASDAATADRVYTANCDAGVGAACLRLVDAITAGKLPATGRDLAALRRRGCLGGAREACDAVSGGLGRTVEAGTRVTWFADETFTNGRNCKAVGPLLWESGARWTGTLVCNSPTLSVTGALLSVEGWPLRSPVRVVWAKDRETFGPWAGIGSLCRTGLWPGQVSCMDGKDYFLGGDTVLEPVAPELVQLPPRKPVKKRKRVHVEASVPRLEFIPYPCVADEELRWTPDGWYEGAVRCENTHTVLERVILAPK